MTAPMVRSDGAGLAEARSRLVSGGVLVFPTETLYGLGCDAADPAAVARIYDIKGRGWDKPLPLIAADMASAEAAAVIPGWARELVNRFWPGPLTVIVATRIDLPPGAAREGRTALRVSPHPVAAGLARALAENGPGLLTATSANRSGHPAAITAGQAAREMDGAADGLPEPDLIVDNGPCPGGAPSTIIDLTAERPRLVRAGAIPAEELGL